MIQLTENYFLWKKNISNKSSDEDDESSDEKADLQKKRENSHKIRRMRKSWLDYDLEHRPITTVIILRIFYLNMVSNPTSRFLKYPIDFYFKQGKNFCAWPKQITALILYLLEYNKCPCDIMGRNERMKHFFFFYIAIYRDNKTISDAIIFNMIFLKYNIQGYYNMNQKGHSPNER